MARRDDDGERRGGKTPASRRAQSGKPPRESQSPRKPKTHSKTQSKTPQERRDGSDRQGPPPAAKARQEESGTTRPHASGSPSNRRRPSIPPGLDLVYGVHAGEAALANPARTIRAVWALPEVARRLTDRQALTPPRASLLEIADADALAARLPAGAVHQGLVVLAEPLPEPDISDAAAMACVAVLDQVTDPHNLGAILRSAAAFGVEAVVTTERHAPAVTGLVAKTASGALERVPLVRVTNLARAIETLQGHGFFCLGLAGETETDLGDAIADTPRLALVLGAEGPGLRRLTRERCDTLARIPMPGGMDSLNVSNAAAIAFYLASRRGA